MRASGGAAVVTPTVASLCVRTWKNTPSGVDHGYFLDLEQFHCGWLPLAELRGVDHRGRRFYESPALIGCALAVHRELYERLRGFDPHMLTWGVEDLDFGLKCWLLGFPILHDPEATVGHRFRSRFDNYLVPLPHVVANQLRMAYKHFTQGTWADWVERCRTRHGGRLLDCPEGLWARAWSLFESKKPSVQFERAHLVTNRPRDEFWFADRFGLSWPRLQSTAFASRGMAFLEGQEGEPSPSPPPCNLTGINPSSAMVGVGETAAFNAMGTNLEDAEWSTTPPGNPATGNGAVFGTKWDTPGVHKVTVSCGDTSKDAEVTVVQVTIQPDPVKTGFNKREGDPIIKVQVEAFVEPEEAVESVTIEAAGVHPERISIENIQPRVNGKITFDVKGVSATPSNKPDGDTEIVAKLNGHVCGQAAAIVLIPKSLVPSSMNGPVTGVNYASDKTTSPAFPGPLAPGAVHLWTVYVHWMTIAVADQFGNLLAPFYEGASVTEEGGVPINQTISGFGTYQDPVGVIFNRPGQSNFPATDPIALGWPTAATVPFVAALPMNQIINVQVGGHQLNPGIVDRKVISTTPPDNIQIIWE